MSAATVSQAELGGAIARDGAEEPVLLKVGTDAELTDQLLGVVLRPPRWLNPAIAVTAAGALVLFAAVAYTLVTGIGVIPYARNWGTSAAMILEA